MPNRKTHSIFGIITGSALATAKGQQNDCKCSLIEAASGALGGFVGSRLPDAIEPANSPHHRQLVHSLVAGTSVTVSYFKLFQDLEKKCRSKAKDYRLKSEQLYLNGNERFIFNLKKQLWLFITGFISGVIAGYISHLVLDSDTPKRLPII